MEGSEEKVVGVVTRSHARRVAPSATLGADYNTAESPSNESSVSELDEPELGCPVSQGVWADCRSAEPPIEAPDSAEIVAEGEEGVLRVEESCAGIPHPAGNLGGSTHAVVLLGCEAVGLGTQSGSQSGMSDSLLGVTSEGGEASNSAKSWRLPSLRSVPETGNGLFLCLVTV